MHEERVPPYVPAVRAWICQKTCRSSQAPISRTVRFGLPGRLLLLFLVKAESRRVWELSRLAAGHRGAALGLDGEKPCRHLPASEGQLQCPVWHYRCDGTCACCWDAGLVVTRWSVSQQAGWYSSRGPWVTGSAGALVFRGSCGVSQQGQGSCLVQGRSLYSPQTCRGGPVLSTPTPDHNGTVHPRKAARCGCEYKRTSNT